MANGFSYDNETAVDFEPMHAAVAASGGDWRATALPTNREWIQIQRGDLTVLVRPGQAQVVKSLLNFGTAACEAQGDGDEG